MMAEEKAESSSTQKKKVSIMSSEPATVGGKEVRVEIKENDVDIHNRDPEEINSYLKVDFEHIFAEPHESIYSFDKIWTLSYAVFSTVKLWWYRILTVIFAIPLAVIWGINFACLSCIHIWVYVPATKCYFMQMHCVKSIFDSVVSAFVQPCATAYGYIFSKIRFTLIKE